MASSNTALKRGSENDRQKWQFCLNDYLEYGAATWENIVRILASTGSPFGLVVKAKHLARKYGVDFHAAMAILT